MVAATAVLERSSRRPVAATIVRCMHYVMYMAVASMQPLVFSSLSVYNTVQFIQLLLLQEPVIDVAVVTSLRHADLS